MGPAAEGVVTIGHTGISVLIQEALAVRRQQEALGEHGVVAEVEETARGEMGLDQSIGVEAGRTSAYR